MTGNDITYASGAQYSALAYAPLVQALSLPACLVLGPDHRVALANEAFKPLLATHTQGVPIGNAVLPALRDIMQTVLDNVRDTGTMQRSDCITLPPDTRTFRYFDLVFSPLHDASQQLDGVLVQVMDRTAQIEALQREDRPAIVPDCALKQYQVMLTHFPNGAMFLFDRDLRYHVARGSDLDEQGSAMFEGKTIWEIWPTEIAERDAPYLQAALAGESSVVEVAHGSGTYEVRTQPVHDPDGSIPYGLVVTQDVTERKRIENALRDSEERFRQIAENIEEIFWLHDLETHKILYISPAYEVITGRSRDALLSGKESLSTQLFPEDRARVLAAGMKQRIGQFDEQFRIVLANGTLRWLRARLFPIVDDDGVVRRLAGVAEDITDRKAWEEDLRQRALYDPLTELPNRTLLFDRLERLSARRKRYPHVLSALLFLDLDDFKSINDTQGHLIGDQLLVDVARALESCVRPGDTVARLGGDEFVIVLESLEDVEAAQTIAQRVIDSLAELEGTRPTGVSIGIALSSDGNEPTTMLHHADVAMYMAKEHGRGRFMVFEPTLHANEVGSSRLEPPTR